MIFDSAILTAIVAELQPFLGARLRDLWLAEPSRQDSESRALYLSFPRSNVVIDTHPQSARVHLTEDSPPPASLPTPFIEAAHKTLRGARLAAIEQPHFERILRLTFVVRDAIGNPARFTLVAEIMERRSNIILLDENETIIDALKRLPPFLNRVRTVLPHRPYQPPPGAKASPLDITEWDAFFALHTPEVIATGAAAISDGFVKLLRSHFAGISPLVGEFLRYRLAQGATPAVACAAFFDSVQRAANGDLRPVLCGKQPYPFALNEECLPAIGTLSGLIEAGVEGASEAQELEGERAALIAHLGRLDKRLAAQREDVEKALRHAADAENYKRQGQLLLAHLAEVESAASRGESFIDLHDEWSENGEILRIPIEPKWPAADSATRCFNRYKRAQKLAADAPARRIELDEEEQALARWRAAALAAQNIQELQKIGAGAGFDRAPKKNLSRTREQQEAARPENKLRRREVEGWTLFMGRSAIENHLLLSKVASPSDMWMHVRGMPSAHVLIKAQKGKVPPPKVLEEGGRWVASAGRNSKKTEGELVETIYTPAKWVRAVKGSPGRVTLQRFQTLDVRV